jgi:hypothetical protein
MCYSLKGEVMNIEPEVWRGLNAKQKSDWEEIQAEISAGHIREAHLKGVSIEEFVKIQKKIDHNIGYRPFPGTPPSVE